MSNLRAINPASASENNDNEDFTTSTFLALCYRCKLTLADLEIMTVGDCLDYIEEYTSILTGDKDEKEKVRTAEQSDFDFF